MKIAVVGQGYVGLTVAVGAANAGHIVIGIDTNVSLINEITKGNTHVPGIDIHLLKELIHKGNYFPTNNFELLIDCEVIIIAVPTPLDTNRKPDLKYLESASVQIAEYISNNILVINESTSYPGTLRNFIKPLIELKSNKNLLFAAAPERVDPGNSNWNLSNTPRIIAGLTAEASIKTADFYSTFCESVHKVSSPEVAEAAKLFENTFRQVNIALSNEFSVISNRMGFSSYEAIKAAATKPFGFMPFYPGVGVGGHCIPVDPTYLSYAAELSGGKAAFIDLANKINLNMPNFVVERIKHELNVPLRNLRVQIAGISYKAGVSDLRESPALLLINELERSGAIVTWCDPLVSIYQGVSSVDLDPSVDLGLIVTPHAQIDFSVWAVAKTKVFDLSSNSVDYGWPKFL